MFNIDHVLQIYTKYVIFQNLNIRREEIQIQTQEVVSEARSRQDMVSWTVCFFSTSLLFGQKIKSHCLEG